MRRLRRHLEHLKRLKNAAPSLRRQLLDDCDSELIKCICEIADNALNGNLKLTAPKISRLKRYKKLLRKIADRKVPLKLKRSLIVQKGGFLPLLLAPPLSLIGGLTGRAIGKAVGL